MSKISKEDMNWAVFAHLGAFAGFLVPLGNIFAPLIIYLMKKSESSYITGQAREVLNFQISTTIYFIISLFLTLIFIGVLLIIALIIIDLVYTIKGAMAASHGKEFTYPFTLRLVQ